MAKKTFKIPIGFKLVSIMALILISATLTVVYIATKLFTDDNTAFIQKSNSDVAAQLSNQTYEYFNNLVHTFTTITELQKSPSVKHQFSRNKEILGVATWSTVATISVASNFSEEGLKYRNFIDKIKPSSKVWSGQIDIQRVTFNGQGFIMLGFPLVVDQNKKLSNPLLVLLINQNLFKPMGKKVL